MSKVIAVAMFWKTIYWGYTMAGGEGKGRLLDQMVREGLSEKVTSELRYEASSM